jgi:hypothetical protein
MIIKRKTDVKMFLVYFCDYAEWDGTKYFIKLDGVTLMQYTDGSCTYHRKTEMFEDIKETEMSYEFVWKNRKLINSFLKSQIHRCTHEFTHNSPIKA